MNEQRLEAYLNLIQTLLTCPQGQEVPILNDHQHLIDDGLIETMQAVAQIKLANGDNNAVKFLEDMAIQLSDYLLERVSPQDYHIFLMHSFQIIAESQGNAEVVYPFFAQNLNKLNESLGLIVQGWMQITLGQVNQEQAQTMASVVNTFGELIEKFPQGAPAVNLGLAIDFYQTALTVYSPDNYPAQWAATKNNLARAMAAQK